MLRRLLALASLVSEHGAPECTRFSSSASQLSYLEVMWDLPGPGMEPLSGALAADS